MSSVTVYTKTGCPYCAAAKKHYTDSKIPFTEINVHEVPGAEAKALEISGGKRIVPIIVENGRVTLGFGGG